MNDDFNDDLNTPTEADLDDCYGSKYLSAADLGDKKIKTRIAKIRKEPMRQQGGKPWRAPTAARSVPVRAAPRSRYHSRHAAFSKKSCTGEEPVQLKLCEGLFGGFPEFRHRIV